MSPGPGCRGQNLRLAPDQTRGADVRASLALQLGQEARSCQGTEVKESSPLPSKSTSTRLSACRRLSGGVCLDDSPGCSLKPGNVVDGELGPRYLVAMGGKPGEELLSMNRINSNSNYDLLCEREILSSILILESARGRGLVVDDGRLGSNWDMQVICGGLHALNFMGP